MVIVYIIVIILKYVKRNINNLHVQHMQDQRLKFLDTRLLPLIIGLIAAEREYFVVSAIVTLLPCCRENVNKN